MKRGGPLKRKTPLKSKKGLRTGGSLQRSAMHRSPKKKFRAPRKGRRVTDDGWLKARTAALLRDNHQCRVRLPGCRGRADQVHHRLRRSQGGKHDLDNLLSICTPCHNWVHANPARSYKAGWLIRSGR